MPLTANTSFCINDWQVSPAEGVLTRGDETVRLEPKAMEVLVYLAEHAGQVITREALERDVWQGALVGYDAVTNTVIKLRKALQDDAKNPSYIQTIPKKGYKLIATLTEASQVSQSRQPQSTETSVNEHTHTGTQAPHSEPQSVPPTAKRLTKPVQLGITVLIVMAVALVIWLSLTPTTQSSIPSVIVLPFTNLGDDNTQNYLAEGMTEDIITDLSRMSNLQVLASSTSEKYKEKQVEPKQIGQELNVSYVLKGNIRQLGDELRVNAQLIETSSGFNVWAERYDRKVTEVFSVQDDVTQNIVNALAIKLTSQEKQRLSRRPTDSLKAYDYFQEGQWLYKVNTIESSRRANEMYRKAIELDPEYGRAYGAYAVNMAMEYRRGWSDSPTVTLDRALALAKKAVKQDDSIPQTYWALGFVHLARKEFDKAEQAAQKSIDVAPNYADGYGLLALIKSYTGQPELAIELNNKAIKLNPYYSYEYLNTYGIAYYTMGNYSEAIKVLERAHQRNPNHVVMKLILTASYVGVKRLNEAEWLVNEIAALSPNLTLETVANNIPFDDKQTVQSLVKDLRTAGLPE
ncbi:MAG: winged helix-turn-helix domain-containing protein [Thioalkalispiraceae bacterium]|jgi:TolB-like protein/DNA-binding winged helix-turn-helix (wHTH) protein/Tfp pilus assembly protein PilF